MTPITMTDTDPRPAGRLHGRASAADGAAPHGLCRDKGTTATRSGPWSEGAEILHTIARTPVATVRKNVPSGWTLREHVRVQRRMLVTRILCRYGYPSDKQEKATQNVFEQVVLFAAEWAMVRMHARCQSPSSAACGFLRLSA